MERFWDLGEPFKDHRPFRIWQQKHSEGFVLNSRSKPGNLPLPMFHKSLCPHVADHSSASLTTNPKFCSTDQLELRILADEGWNGIELCDNRDCLSR